MARLFTSANSESLDNDSAPVTSLPITFSSWGKATDTGTTGLILSVVNKDIGTMRWGIYAQADDVFYFVATTGIGGSTNALADNVWFHIAARSVTTTDHAVFVNGVSAATNGTERIMSGTNRVSVGRFGDSTPSSHFDGLIAEAGIWDVALTDAEIAILALGYSPLFVRPSSLVFYAPLIRGVTATGGNDIDIVGGLTLTDNNTVTVGDHPRIIRPSGSPWSPFAVAVGGAVLDERRYPRGVMRGAMRGAA